jgi:hypothetical protein
MFNRLELRGNARLDWLPRNDPVRQLRLNARVCGRAVDAAF